MSKTIAKNKQRNHYRQKLSEDFIREFSDRIDWEYISYQQKLSENFIREFSNKVDWNGISYRQKLSEKFIREFSDKVDWKHISYRQKLSEDFIREFKDRVNWREISENQKLSEDFVEEFDLDYQILNIVSYCGDSNRKICILKDTPEIIHIGCFTGTKQEAIKAVSEKYSGKAKKKYLAKIEKCFNF